MRTTVASALILFLVSVVALCPAIVCPITAPSCCHKPAKTTPDCPYSILEKSKASPVVTHAKWVASIVRAEHRAVILIAGPTVEVPSRMADVSGLFLRNRVLLI
jgi:hypothetical protein